MAYGDTGLPSTVFELTRAYEYANKWNDGHAVYDLLGKPRISSEVSEAFPHVVRRAKILYEAQFTMLAAAYLMAGPPPLDRREAMSEYDRIEKITRRDNRITRQLAIMVVRIQGRGALTNVRPTEDMWVRSALMAEVIDTLETLNKECKGSESGALRAEVRLGAHSFIDAEVAPVEVLQQKLDKFNKNYPFIASFGDKDLRDRYEKALKESVAHIQRLRPPPAQTASEKQMGIMPPAEPPKGIGSLNKRFSYDHVFPHFRQSAGSASKDNAYHGCTDDQMAAIIEADKRRRKGPGG